MKPIFPLITFLFLASCSDPEDLAEIPSSEDEKSVSTSTAKASTDARKKSPAFDISLCKFLTEAQIKETLGDQITEVSIAKPSFISGTCQKRFTLTLANGKPLNLVFRIEPYSKKGIEKDIKEFSDNARDIPRLIKMEMAADGRTHIGTHISQRRLYMFRASQEATPTLTYDVRGAAGGQTPEEVEARRQMGLSLINEMLKE